MQEEGLGEVPGRGGGAHHGEGEGQQLGLLLRLELLDPLLLGHQQLHLSLLKIPLHDVVRRPNVDENVNTNSRVPS